MKSLQNRIFAIFELLQPITLLWLYFLLSFLLGTSVWAKNFHGSNLQGSRIGTHWQAQNLEGKTILAQQMQGVIRVYFFGYTHCPDVCPTTLAELASLFEELTPEQAAQVRITMVTVDPERDTPTVLKQYLAYFDSCLRSNATCTPHFDGVTGSLTQIKQMAKSFKVFFRKVPLNNDANTLSTKPLSTNNQTHSSPPVYTMEHSANLFVMDKMGQPRLFYYGDVDSHLIAADIQQLLQEGQQ